MTPFVSALVLLAALLHASWNALAKSGGTPEYSIAAFRLVSAIVCLPLLLVLPLPLAASWPLLLASVAIHTIYYVTLSRAYRNGDLSQVYPLFRGEWLSPGGLAGIALVSAGLVSIALLGGAAGRLSAPAAGWGLATALAIAAYTVADGLGVRAAGNPFSYIAWLFVLEPLPIGAWLLCYRRGGWFAYMRATPGRIAGGSLRETSVIFAALIGTLVFGEAFGRQRVFAAVLVCAGVALIKWLA